MRRVMTIGSLWNVPAVVCKSFVSHDNFTTALLDALDLWYFDLSGSIA